MCSQRKPLGRLALLGVAAAAIMLSACTGEPRTPFDRQAWIGADPVTRARAEMVDDLLAHHPLVGMRRDEVIALLGPPTVTDKFPQAEMVYVLGPYGPYMIDFQWLLIDLGPSGRVVAVGVAGD